MLSELELEELVDTFADSDILKVFCWLQIPATVAYIAENAEFDFVNILKKCLEQSKLEEKELMKRVNCYIFG